MSFPRFCELCGDPLPADRFHVCADCDRPAAEPAAGGDTGARIVALFAVGTAVLAAAGWVAWYFWHAAAVID